MFLGCSSLKELNINNFNTNNVSNMKSMFNDEHPKNIQLILVTSLVLKLLRFNSLNAEHP